MAAERRAGRHGAERPVWLIWKVDRGESQGAMYSMPFLGGTAPGPRESDWTVLSCPLTSWPEGAQSVPTPSWVAEGLEAWVPGQVLWEWDRRCWFRQD